VSFCASHLHAHISKDKEHINKACYLLTGGEDLAHGYFGGDDESIVKCRRRCRGCRRGSSRSGATTSFDRTNIGLGMDSRSVERPRCCHRRRLFVIVLLGLLCGSRTVGDDRGRRRRLPDAQRRGNDLVGNGTSSNSGGGNHGGVVALVDMGVELNLDGWVGGWMARVTTQATMIEKRKEAMGTTTTTRESDDEKKKRTSNKK